MVLSLMLFTSEIDSQTRELSSTGEFLDSVVAIVNDGIVLRSELENQLSLIISNLEQQGGQLPPIETIRENLLERLILERIQLQRADRYGIRVTDEILNNAIANVASNNNVSFEEFPAVLAQEGISYNDYRSELRQQLTIEQLRQREVISRIAVTESELDSFLVFQKEQDALNYDYNLSHILIPTSSRAGTKEIANKESLIYEIREIINEGGDFAQLAKENSKGQQAASGGNLGWMKGNQLPEIFIKVTSQLQPGELSQPFQTTSGFLSLIHI